MLHGTLGGQKPPNEEEDCGVPTEKQRRATAKRKLERQLERRAQQARRRRILTIAAVAAVVVVVACVAVWAVFFRKGNGTPTASSTTTSVAPTQEVNCSYQPTPADPAAKPVTPPNAGPVKTDPATVSMSITTNQGPIGLQLDNAKSPCTVNNFASLAQQGFFNDTHCHRLTTGQDLYVLQCGDPKADGKGGPGYQFADEYPVNQFSANDPAQRQPFNYPRGTLAMANIGPGTNGSQFFIVYKDSKLPPSYTIFGKVDEKDLAVLDKIAAAGTVNGAPDGKPKTDVVITSARLD